MILCLTSEITWHLTEQNNKLKPSHSNCTCCLDINSIYLYHHACSDSAVCLVLTYRVLELYVTEWLNMLKFWFASGKI